MRPVLFLDFDGVLNTRSGRIANGIEHICPQRVELVNQIVERTGCAVVVSSTWRLLFSPKPLFDLQQIEAMQQILDAAGAKFAVYGVTPTIENSPRWPTRGDEIQKWLDDRPEETGPFASVDDEAPMGHLEHRCVRTNDQDGLTQAHVERLVTLLTERA